MVTNSDFIDGIVVFMHYGNRQRLCSLGSSNQATVAI